MLEQRPLRVLLLEDNPQDAFLLRAALERAGLHYLQLLHAERLADALQLLTTDTVDLILTDLNLPDSIGLETVAELARNTTDVPILVLTGQSDPDLERELLQHGASGKLSKDLLHSPAFAETIQNAVRRS